MIKTIRKSQIVPLQSQNSTYCWWLFWFYFGRGDKPKRRRREIASLKPRCCSERSMKRSNVLSDKWPQILLCFYERWIGIREERDSLIRGELNNVGLFFNGCFLLFISGYAQRGAEIVSQKVKFAVSPTMFLPTKNIVDTLKWKQH